MRFIGCKTALLSNIKEVIDDNIKDAYSFCDLFSGTASVARFFKQWYEISSNDLLYFSYVLQKATIENDQAPLFINLKKSKNISDPIEYFNQMSTSDMQNLDLQKRFFQNTYAPSGGRMYLNDDNALRVDFARNTVESWFNSKLISTNEYFYLIASIIEGIPFISNISGTYGAFHKTWDKRTFKKYELIPLDIISNGKNNKCFNINALQLIDHIKGDILYLDPPYNARQYLPNYHVLETGALYDYPEVRGVTALRPYENKKSSFCIKSQALASFKEIIHKAQFKHILLSYSTDGIMPLEEIIATLKYSCKSSSIRVYKFPYRRFKSRTLTKHDDLKELVIYCQKT